MTSKGWMKRNYEKDRQSNEDYDYKNGKGEMVVEDFA
jgi:hypothetical protein